MKILDPEMTEQQIRNYLGSFGFAGSKAKSKVAPFSGGEKSRLALALLCYQRPNLLLLDEPTNHLDLEMRQALAMALQAYRGAVIIVSHDRHLLRLNSDQLILVHAGKANYFDGDLDDYPSWIAEQARQEKPQTPNANQNSALERKQQKRLQAERRQQLQPIRKKIVTAEKLVDQYTTEQQTIEQQLANNDLYDESNKEKLKQLLAQQGTIKQNLEDAEWAWMSASEEYEALEKEMGSENG